MANSLTLSRSVNGGGITDSQSATYTGSSLLIVQEPVADGQTNKAITGAADVSAMKALYISADGNCLLETNSGSAPDDSFTLKANQPVVWGENDSTPNPLGTDVTGFFLTNASGATVNLTIMILQDATP